MRPRDRARLKASSSSLGARLAETAVAASAAGPSSCWATTATSVESTPAENAVIAEPQPRTISRSRRSASRVSTVSESTPSVMLGAVETHEVLEHVEQAEESAHEREDFGRHAAVLVSVLAALLALASLAGNRASTEAILAQARASDTYNEYEANSLKRHVNLDDAAQLTILAAGTPNQAQATQQATSLQQDVAQKYQPAQD